MTAETEERTEASPPHKQSVIGKAVAVVRNTWRGLTSMRTALVLLFLLALSLIHI